MPSLAAFSFDFQISLLEHVACFVRLLLCTFTCLSAAFKNFGPFVLHRGKQFCPYLVAIFECISAAFILSDTKKDKVACCLSLVQTSGGAIIFTSCPHGLWIAAEPHSQHVTF
jgi:hypothetical protein